VSLEDVTAAAQWLSSGDLNLSTLQYIREARTRGIQELADGVAWVIKGLEAERSYLASQSRYNELPIPDSARKVLLGWELLPSGWWGQERKQRLVQARSIVEMVNEQIRFERLGLLDSLKLMAWYSGSRLENRSYHVAEYHGVVIAESPDFGNALYYLLDQAIDWHAVFSQSKRKALHQGAQRLVQSGDWQGRVSGLVQSTAS
jgi:hypothetical protein